jgi:hypothetical protein
MLPAEAETTGVPFVGDVASVEFPGLITRRFFGSRYLLAQCALLENEASALRSTCLYPRKFCGE